MNKNYLSLIGVGKGHIVGLSVGPIDWLMDGRVRFKLKYLDLRVDEKNYYFVLKPVKKRESHHEQLLVQSRLVGLARFSIDRIDWEKKCEVKAS